MNRRGFIGDAAFVVAILLVLGLTMVVAYNFFTELNTQFQDTDHLTNTSKESIDTLHNRYTGLWDGIFMLVFGLLAVGLVLSTAALGTRPEFFFLVVIISLFVVGGAAAVSNVWSDAVGTDLAVSASSFPFTSLILGNLVEITLALIGILLVGLFVKARGIL